MITWKFKSLDVDLASVRYRGLRPATLLEARGLPAALIERNAVPDWESTRLVVFIKSFTTHDLALAQTAVARRIPVVLDLCDNIFVERYPGGRDGNPASVFEAMARLASCVVVPTTALAAVVRERIGPPADIRVVPDGIERIDDILQWRQRLQHVEPARRRGWSGLLRKRERRALLRRLRERLRPDPTDHRSDRTATARAATQQQPGPDPERSRILWFGNSGAAHGHYGLTDLLQCRTALQVLARERPVELVVVSNDASRFRELIQPFELTTTYIPWSADGLPAVLPSMDVVVLPNSGDPFSATKSANRALLALAHGVPVVATPTAALAPLAPCTLPGDWLSDLRRYLDDPDLRRRHLEIAHEIIEAEYADAAILRRWQQLLADCRPLRRPRRLGVVVALVQDVDLLEPVLHWATDRYELSILIEQRLAGEHGHVLDLATRWDARLVNRDRIDDIVPDLARLDVLLTASETTLRPHRFAHTVTLKARELGVRTLTMQHGLENVGLTWSDTAQPIERVDFASDSILLWGPATTLLPSACEHVRARCVSVGCVKRPRAEPLEAELVARLSEGRDTLFGVFENLHWGRYDDAFRQLFMEALEALAHGLPAATVVLRPHPAGRWLTERYRDGLPNVANLRILDPADPELGALTSSRLLPNLSGVITTPSTVAADAARAGCPVAIAAGALELERYAPLRRLRSADDWLAFARDVISGGIEGDLRAAEAFTRRNFVEGDVMGRLESTFEPAPLVTSA